MTASLTARDDALLRQILLRDWVVGALGIPEDRHDPPPRAVVHELEAVDAAGERLRIFLRATRFVRAERVRDVSERVRLAADLAFEEAILFEVRAGTPDVAVDVEHPRNDLPLL